MNISLELTGIDHLEQEKEKLELNVEALVASKFAENLKAIYVELHVYDDDQDDDMGDWEANLTDFLCDIPEVMVSNFESYTTWLEFEILFPKDQAERPELSNN